MIYSIPDKYVGQKPRRFTKPRRFRTQGFFWNTIDTHSNKKLRGLKNAS